MCGIRLPSVIGILACWTDQLAVVGKIAQDPCQAEMLRSSFSQHFVDCAIVRSSRTINSDVKKVQFIIQNFFFHKHAKS